MNYFRVNDTSVATLLAQFVPDVLKTEFDECITMHERERMNRGLCLDFRYSFYKGVSTSDDMKI